MRYTNSTLYPPCLNLLMYTQSKVHAVQKQIGNIVLANEYSKAWSSSETRDYLQQN